MSTTTAAVDLISCMLEELGICGIEVEDNIPLSEADTKGMFVDILPELPPDDGTAKVHFYLDEACGLEDLTRRIEEGLDEISRFVDVGQRTLVVSETEDKDWINNWKQYFKPFAVDDILIKPTWEEIPREDKDKLIIQIDPGLAFGTGKHETTQLCIRQLKKYMQKGANVLDVGTGSGILGIAALKLGAGEVFGTDLDENAIAAVKDNLLANGLSKARFRTVKGDIINDAGVQEEAGDGRYDIVVANILAPVIIQLQAEVARHMKRGAIFIASGILDVQETQVRAALAANKEFEIVESCGQGEWISLTAKRR